VSIQQGTIVGRYVIETLIGVGGMGEVYRAFDTELERPVALKFLHAHVASDENRMARFIQEARSASALNHPNILTVHDIGQTDEGVRFFATEFVDGTTLREHIDRKPLKLGEVLDVASQIASALVAAHAAGIVHRDIKPENVMVRRDGYVKVLDFGLAKVAGHPSSAVDTEAATRAWVNTAPGAVMGTVNYMSPEQARGEEADHRTDIWSLGVVVYEMLAGRAPFEGRSPSHTLVAVLDHEPPPLAHYLVDAPDALQEVVTDALTKDAEARFQTAKQMLAKLQRLKYRLDTGASLEHSVPPNQATSSGELLRWSASDGARPTHAHARRPTAHSGGGGLSRQAARGVSFGRLSVEGAGGGGKFVALAVLLFIAVGAGAFAFYRLAWRGGEAQRQQQALAFASPRDMKLQRLPASGATVSAAVSPDGKYAARVVLEGGRASLRLRQLATTNERELIAPDALARFAGAPAFSHDGNHVYYVAGRRGNAFFELFRIPVLGGEPQKLIYDVDSAATLSPDGRRLAFRRHLPREAEDVIVVANEDGSGERIVASYKTPRRIDNPAWSPDGKAIAYTVSGTDAEGYYVNIDAVGPDDGLVRTISPARWRALGQLAWLSDASGLVTNARDRASLPSTPMQLWHVSAADGAAQKITNDLTNYVGVSLTADSRTVLAKQGWDVMNVWVAPEGDGARARQLTNTGTNGNSSIAWMPDGRVVYESDASGNADIWVMNADGTGRKQLTFDPLTDAGPSVSPDGRYIVFRSNRGVGWGIWRMQADGSNVRELLSNLDGAQAFAGQFSPDSRWLYYSARDRRGKLAFWKISVEGGEPVMVIEEKIGYARLSPDGRSVFSVTQELEPDAPTRIYIFPAEGGAPLKMLDAPEDMTEAREWSPDGRSIDYVSTREGVGNVWRLPLSGGRPRQLTDWRTDLVYRFSWSPDGKLLAAARGTPMTDLVLIRDFR
jgi:serine/threonine protein kinase/Tol biopolymer transport system component